jgi:hypothetical protein
MLADSSYGEYLVYSTYDLSRHMTKHICTITGEEFEISDWALDLLQKMDMPLPKTHPNERHRHRISFRNDRSLYNRQCDKTGAQMLSIYSKDSLYPIYSPEAYNSDNWDPTDYGKDFDFSRPFFEQFQEMRLQVPRISLHNIQGENSEYCNNTIRNKNCYLCFGSEDNMDIYHSIFAFNCQDCSDLIWSLNCELSYDCVDCLACYNVSYSQYSHNCSESQFLYECRNLKNCFGCVGLKHKQYCIFNQQYTKEEYEAKLAEYRLDTWEGVQHMRKEFAKFLQNSPHRYAQISNSENCSGDYINDSKNSINCYMTNKCEDYHDVIGGIGGKSAYSSCFVGLGGEFYYELLGSIGGVNNALGIYNWGCSDTRYCDSLQNSQDCFGCVGLKRKQYCILNKQYTKEEYEKMLPKLIAHMKSTGEWGKFFPISMSPFAYNETVAQDYFQLSEQEAVSRGFKWKKMEAKTPGSFIMPIDDEDILKQSFNCEVSGRPYRFVPQELKLYRQIHVPIPHWAPETRHMNRISKRNPFQTWNRHCDECSCEIETSFAPERPEKVYCESCFLAKMY